MGSVKAVFKAGSGPGGTGKNPYEKYIVHHQMGEIIFSEGDIGTDMYIVQSGTVELLKAIGGETRVLSTLERGDFFGEMSVLEDVPRNASARAKSDVELVRINGATFDAMLKSNTEIAIRMMRKLSRRLREVTAMLEDSLGRQVAEEERPAQRKVAPDANASRLVCEDPPAEFFLNREGDTLVGRSDPVTGITPDVDLTPLDPQRSTSRRHAKLYQMSDTYYVMEEIGVMNGTYVNGNRVATGVPIAVQNGDVLKFGLVSLTFHSPEAP